MITNRDLDNRFVRFVCERGHRVIVDTKSQEYPKKCPKCGSKKIYLETKTEVITK